MNSIKAVIIACLVLLTSTSASAVTIIKFDLGGTGPDFTFDGSTLKTVNDGNAVTTGDQNTGLDFQGFLDGSFADIIAGASLSVANVAVSGTATLIGAVVSQITTGGTFDVYDPSNGLLLSGVLNDGVLTGSTNSSSGSFFNTSVASFNGGSLLSLVASTPAGFAISFTNLVSSTGAFMQVSGNVLQPFSADATGQIAGSPIPEPATVALLLSGLIGGLARKRKLV